MHIFLDDDRATPPGWHRTYQVEETIKLLQESEERVQVVSLDNDLGFNIREGKHVALWIEEMAFNCQDNPELVKNLPKEVIVHTANSKASREMLFAIRAANNFLMKAGIPKIRCSRASHTPCVGVYNSSDPSKNMWIINE